MKQLTFQQNIFKIADRYDVLDERDRIIYTVAEQFNWLKYIAHVTDPQGDPVFKIEKKTWSWRPEYNIYFRNGRDVKIKKRWSFFKKKVDILSGEALYLEGDIWDLHYIVYQNETMLGKIDKEFFTFRDRYKLTIYDEEHQDLILAVALAVDDMIDEEQKDRSSS